MKLSIRYTNLLDIINLNFNVYYPLKGFVSKDDFLSIVKKYKLTNNKFFPLPIYINISSTLYNKCKKYKKIGVFYKSKRVCDLKIKSFYTLDKMKIGEKIFQTKNIKHPGFNQFLKTGNYFINCEVKDFNNKIMRYLHFSYPFKLKSMFLRHDLRSIVGFHTRNVPHKAHEWIHAFGLRKCQGLFIQPIIGQFKKNEYNEKIIIKSNLKLIKEIYKKKNIFFGLFNSYPRYAGPREALFHAIVRRNYGCTHFLVGRDHAGVGKFYTKYESQKLCLKYEKDLKIKIIVFKEPYLCISCKKIVNKKCPNCNKNSKKLISGTMIRKLLSKNLKIPNIYMRKRISNLLKPNSII